MTSLDEDLAVALRPREDAVALRDQVEPFAADCLHGGRDSCRAQPLVSYDSLAARRDLSPDLELGLDECHEVPPDTRATRNGRRQFSNTDEGRVDDCEIDCTPDCFGCQRPSIRSLHYADALIGPKPLCELPIADVHGYNAARASLEQTIGKSSRGCPKVQAATAPHVELESVKGSGKLHSTTRDERMVRRAQTYVHVYCNEGASLVDSDAVDGDVAPQKDCLGTRPCRHEASGYEKLIDPYLRHVSG
jgi:hypothetical protein